MPNADPRLLIDDVQVGIGNVWIHAQDDPYPGGHRFVIWLPADLATYWLSRVGLESGKAYRDLLFFSRKGLLFLAGALGSWRIAQKNKEVKPWLFVLNTIDQVTPAEEGLEIQGECSPFVRRSDGDPTAAAR